jgi:hypothetical protein
MRFDHIENFDPKLLFGGGIYLQPDFYYCFVV